MVVTQNIQNYTGITNANCYTVIQGAMANFVNGTSVTLYQSYTTASPYHLVYAIYNPNDSGTYNTVYLDYSINTSTGAVIITLYETWNTSTLTGTNGARTLSAGVGTGNISTTTFTDSTNSYGIWIAYPTGNLGASGFSYSYYGYVSATTLNFANSANYQPSVQMFSGNLSSGILFYPTARQLGGTTSTTNNGLVLSNSSTFYSSILYLGSCLITNPVSMTNNNFPIGTISSDFYINNSNLGYNLLSPPTPTISYVNGNGKYLPLSPTQNTILLQVA